MGKKICKICKVEKDYEEFYTRKDTKDGHYSLCKKCEIKRKLKYLKENPKKQALISKKWRKENPEKAALAIKKWRKENPEKVKAINNLSSKKWNEKHPEAVRLFTRKYRNDLRDGYVKTLIQNESLLDRRQIPSELIEIKKMQIKVKRLIKSKKDEDTETC